MKKIFAMLLALAMVFALIACSGSNNQTEDKTVKIGVLVADVSGEEALGFRAYYENYIAKNYNVTFTYTEQLADAAAEKSAIEKFAAQGYDAILSLSSADRATQIETAAANKLYYAVVSGMLDDAQFEQYKSNPYFVGQIGPSMDTEFEAGYAMGKHFADQGVKKVGIYGAFIPNPMHVYRTAGVLAGLGCTYGIPYADIDSFTTGNAANMKDGTLVYLAGKYSSSIGPIFAATMNAVKGNPIRDENGNAISLSQNYLVATDSATFDSIFNGDKGDNPIFNKEALDKVIGKVSYSDFAALVASK